jgi:serine protease Do
MLNQARTSAKRQSRFFYYGLVVLILWFSPTVGYPQSGNGGSNNDWMQNGASPKSVSDLLALQEKIRKVTDSILQQTVAVQVGRANGSGVIVSEDGFVLTAAHVAGTPNRDARVFLSDGRIVTGVTMGLNEILDAGMIKITDNGKWPYARLGKSSGVAAGQWCLATGHPGGYDPRCKPKLRFGRVLKVEKSAVLTDCTLSGGDSGGPLFDLQGRVIGIHSRIGRNLTVNVHVPVDRYKHSWDRLVKGEAWDLLQPESEISWIGVKEDAAVTDRVQVGQVVDDSPAAQAGVLPGDHVIELGGVKIDKFDSLKRQVQRHRPGENVSLRIKRGDDVIELDVRIGALRQRETQR